ncbi:MAG TPA: bile acid:sodium symporter family protein [Nevskiaceae bacterium]|nr:bile acid:sodium symporter family protein [Nevskiaceae bacterium]
MTRPRIAMPDGFVIAMLAAVVVAAVAPRVGASDGPLHLGTVTAIGIALVFFLNGAALSPQNLKAGAANWRLHLMVQLSTFVLFPLIGVSVALATGGWLPRDLVTGLIYLCALSSTISTSIAMTAMARGNVAGAIFNATLSSLLGLVVTPLAMSLWLRTSGESLPLADQLLKIVRQLLVPFIVGQLCRPLVGAWIARHKPVTGKIDRFVILLIVYNSFCDSTLAGLWSEHGWAVLAQTFVLTTVLLGAVLSLTTWIARRMRFTVEDEIAAVFCGSKKSLATGIPMAKLLFGAGSSLGLIVLPLMFYHQLQLVVCTFLAQRYAARVEEARRG